MNVALGYNWQGEAVMIAAEGLKARPAVYGVFIENGRVLLRHHPPTNLYCLPGGIVEAHERIADALRHFFRQVTGIMPVVSGLLYAEERFYVDEAECAWQLTTMYYALKRPSTLITALPEWEEESRAEFVPLEAITREQLLFGYDAIQAGRHRHQPREFVG